MEQSRANVQARYQEEHGHDVAYYGYGEDLVPRNIQGVDAQGNGQSKLAHRGHGGEKNLKKFNYAHLHQV